MRRGVTFSLVCAGIALVGATSFGAPATSPSAPTAAPRDGSLANPPILGAMRLLGSQGAGVLGTENLDAMNPFDVPKVHYEGGPLTYEVTIKNPSGKALSANLVVTAGKRPVATVPIGFKPNMYEVKTTFKDDAGLTDGCDGVFHTLTLDTGGDGGTRRVKTSGPCTFAATVVDPSVTATPADRANKMFAATATPTTTPPVCGQPYGIKAVVKNTASANAAGAMLTIDGPQKAISAPFDLAAGASKAVTVSTTPFKGRGGDYVLGLQSSVPTYQSGWRVKVAASCTLSAVGY